MTRLPERVAAALARVHGRLPRRAVVVAAGESRDRSLAACAEHCEQAGYTVAAVADAAVALEMVVTGRADVIVAASSLDLPQVEVIDRSVRPSRVRRVEGSSTSPVRRRPRIVR